LDRPPILTYRGWMPPFVSEEASEGPFGFLFAVTRRRSTTSLELVLRGGAINQVNIICLSKPCLSAASDSQVSATTTARPLRSSDACEIVLISPPDVAIEHFVPAVHGGEGQSAQPVV